MMRMASITSLSFSKTTPLTTNLLQQPPQNVLMPIRDLTFRRISTVNLIQFNHPKFLSTRNNITAEKNSMAEEATSNKINTIESTMNNNKATELQKNQEKSKVNIPPPPEKPLPDDCCGSGCVRCVWDMYYEELEEYNKLYKSIPDTKAS